MQIYWTTINKIINETSEIKTFYLNCPKDFTWDEGSHTHFGLKGFNADEKPNKSLVRHMSISTLPNENLIGITTRIKDQCSEFKSILRKLDIGDEVAIFKTHSNVPLIEDKNIYLLSSGVGLATFRPLILKFIENNQLNNKMHSINVDSTAEYLFKDLLTSLTNENFIAEFVCNRDKYYEKITKIDITKNDIFYIVGSDKFISQNINLLTELGVEASNIIIDKYATQRSEFLSV